MSNPVFEGAAVAIITPFFEDGGINFEELGKMIEFEIENKIDSIVICGSTGEGPSLSVAERKALAEAFVGARKRAAAATAPRQSYGVRLRGHYAHDWHSHRGIGGHLRQHRPRLRSEGSLSGNILMSDRATGDFPMQKLGTNAVSWSGTVTRAVIQPNRRDL